MNSKENESDSHFVRSGKGKWKWILALALIAALLALLSIRPYFWTKAKYYKTAADVSPAAPIMSMKEYGSLSSPHPRPYVLRYRLNDNRLIFYGISRHVNDSKNADVVEIVEMIREMNPTICLIEGKMGTWIAGYQGLVKQFGESGAVSWHARQLKAKIYTLDMPLELEIDHVLLDHKPEHVAMFYVLRPYFGARRNGPIDNPSKFISEPLRKRTKMAGLNQHIRSVEDIDRIWKRDFAGLPDWRDCDDSQGWPGVLDEVGASANLARNKHWINILSELMSQKSGDRIFAVAGCSHVVRLQAAFDSMFEADESNPVDPATK